jgi:beta-phosphoglucomutase-like phosphatase (HAD superfamily)
MSSSPSFLSDVAVALFDFDGLLVDTERTHFAAYQEAMQALPTPHQLDWTFAEYCQAAHWGEEVLEQALRGTALASFHSGISWAAFYALKKAAFARLVDSERCTRLLPGVDAMLRACRDAATLTAVVTNSSDELVASVRAVPECDAALALVQTWFTRGKYTNAKPHPECYIESTRELLASQLAAPAADNAAPLIVLAFEDSPRGLKAIVDAREHFLSSSVVAERRVCLVPVFVTSIFYPELEDFCGTDFVHVDTLEQLLADWTPVVKFTQSH